MADLMLAIYRPHQPHVESVEQLAQENTLHLRISKHTRVWKQLHKRETSSERDVEQPNTAVGRIHRPDNLNVRRHLELPAAGKRERKPALVHFEKGDQLSEDSRDVCPVDLVD